MPSHSTQQHHGLLEYFGRHIIFEVYGFKGEVTGVIDITESFGDLIPVADACVGDGVGIVKPVGIMDVEGLQPVMSRARMK